MSTPEIKPPLVLASGSPRRRELLTGAGIPFEAHPPAIAERPRVGESPEEIAERLAREKAEAVARMLGGPPRRLVLGADTIVVVGADVLGKPEDASHALDLLRRLVGRAHRVLTGVALADTVRGGTRSLVVESRVRMRSASDAELRAYVARGESLDKAGAYAAQGEGRSLIDAIEGSETNVIGLPMDETLALLREAGFPLERAA